ncbi:MAG TPA: ribbon-helix-helix domain-containing protein [Chloroflexaceae bacterium]|nr:ribbon-helix-helix domain-containing protein [Chloroflexaceae bacterium]
MAVKVRKQIYLDPDQETLLKRLAGATGLPEAELIRQAIDRHIAGGLRLHRDRAAWAEERDYIAELMARGPVAGRRTWQREDLYDRQGAG